MQFRQSAFPPPQALMLPVKDALRGVRRTLASSTLFLRPLETALPIAGLPRTLADQAGTFAEQAYVATRRMARSVDPSRPSDAGLGTSRLAAIAASPTPELDFAHAAYEGLSTILSTLEGEAFLVSQTLAAYAYRSAVESAAHGSPHDVAAWLVLRLMDHHVTGRAPGTGLGLDDADRRIIATAAFALLLWLLAEPDGAADEEIRRLAADVAVAIEDEIVAASGEVTRLADLFDEYATII